MILRDDPAKAYQWGDAVAGKHGRAGKQGVGAAQDIRCIGWGGGTVDRHRSDRPVISSGLNATGDLAAIVLRDEALSPDRSQPPTV